MRKTFYVSLLALLVLLCVRPCFGQKQWIFQAMKDEIVRAMSSLSIDTLRPPYYLAYTITDEESHYVRASFGSLLGTYDYPQSRQINVQLRVGTQGFDNSNYVSYGGSGGSRIAYVSEDGTLNTTYEDDYDALRRDLWLATDVVYKKALDDLSRKKAALQNKVRSDTSADFSLAKPYSATTMPVSESFDQRQWQDRAKRLSAVLKKFSGIQSSDVSVGFANDYVYFLNSEGSQHTRRSTRTFVEVKAKTQAADGMPLSDFVAFYGNSLKDLPSEKEMAQQIEAMAQDLTSQQQASLLDSYSGPVLFEKQAAAELIAQGIGPLLCNFREPVTDNPQLEQMIKSQLGEFSFENKIGVRVLPDFLSVSDNPTRASQGGAPLVASYGVDAEGVQARDVKLIEKGTLKTLLTTRAPHKRIGESNGHARGLAPSPFFSNLVLESSKTMKDAELKKKLIAMCEERGLDFGIVIRKISNPYFGRQLRDELDPYAFSGPGRGRQFVTEPIYVYKVFTDGREERVRGVEISGMTPQSLKEIAAASQGVYVYNHIAGQRKPTYSGLFNPADIRVSVVTPSLLFESVDLKKSATAHRTPPIVPHPVFGR